MPSKPRLNLVPFQAVDLFKKNRETVDWVILDALMLKMSGNEDCEMIQGLEPDVFTLFISGDNENVIPTDFMQKFGLEYFQKPFSGEEILLKIRDILESSSRRGSKVEIPPFNCFSPVRYSLGMLNSVVIISAKRVIE
ncbi:MAG TPA: response regulator [Verrucomicrobia bacterium]|nr:response regulator [Verrucomicrobiota bacterium]